MRGIEDPTRLAHRFQLAMSDPFAVAGKSVKLGLDIGIAVTPDDGRVPEDLVRRATMALHHAKSEDRGSVRFFERDTDRRLEVRARIEQELRGAITGGALAAHYHPIVALTTGKIIGFEALARWKDRVLASRSCWITLHS
jgi:predicted signal transduction protein with EAL and GGDEF domain